MAAIIVKNFPDWVAVTKAKRRLGLPVTCGECGSEMFFYNNDLYYSCDKCSVLIDLEDYKNDRGIATNSPFPTEETTTNRKVYYVLGEVSYES